MYAPMPISYIVYVALYDIAHTHKIPVYKVTFWY